MENLRKMMTGFQDFVGFESGVHGALFPGQTEEEDISDEDENGKVSFDPSSFLQTMMNSFGKSPVWNSEFRKIKK
jgi:hypothetical protein